MIEYPKRVWIEQNRQYDINWTKSEVLFIYICVCVYIYIYIKILLFLDRKGEGEREGEKHQYVVASCVAPTGDLACNPGMCPDWDLNQRPFALQAGTQSTEPHQPGSLYIFFKKEKQNQKC